MLCSLRSFSLGSAGHVGVQILCCLISFLKTAEQCLPTCTVLGSGTTNRWLASEGKQIADPIQWHCLMGEITGRWGRLADNGPVQSLKGRWLLTDGSLRVQEESSLVGEEECGRSMVGHHHYYQADESLVLCQPDSAYASTLNVALSYVDVMPLSLSGVRLCFTVGVEGLQGVTKIGNCRRAPPEATQLKDYAIRWSHVPLWSGFNISSLPSVGIIVFLDVVTLVTDKNSVYE